MSDAIASVGAVAPVVIVGASRPPGSGEMPGRPEPSPPPPPPMPALPKTEAANRQALDTEGSYRVRIDAHTLRVIAEVVNPTSGDVLFYLPPGYRPDAPRPEPVTDKSTEAESRG
jgi:hypothetical protein